MNESVREINNLNRTIHEPARLMIMSILSAVESADFLYLLNATGLTKGNLSSHLSRLEKEAYLTIDKSFEGKVTRTTCAITELGQEALEQYRVQMKAAIDVVAGGDLD